MYDVVMALEWVYDNIEYFGGDKARITISGEDGGSVAVSILCVSPLTRGMFSRAIMQSGSIIKLKDNMLNYNMDLSERLAVAVDCANDDSTIYDNPGDVVKCLRDRNATYLMKTLWSFNPSSLTSFFPHYGDDLLPNNALEDIRDGNFHNVPILLGVVSDEGSFSLTTEHPDEFGFFGEKNANINKTYAETLLESTFNSFTDPQKYIDFYLKDISDKAYYQIRRQLYTAIGDTNILCPTVYFAESYAKRDNDVFYYFFTQRPSDTVWAKWMGVIHSEDVQFEFGDPLRATDSFNMTKIFHTKEVLLSRRIMEIWANFAKDGRPAHPKMYPKWKKYTKGNHAYMTIDIHNYGAHGTGPHLKNCNFLRDDFGFS
ncbi:unnamed protein product [Larinioides sclopetarius]|uniref:Carboxylesterase type B domain-containing protein n=1 Tax=Larinioides sclopetarius TaxID=280406 RepID=A0AAV2B948_9ARAC